MGSTVGDPFIGFGVCINSIPEHYAALTLSSIPLPASTIAIQDLRMPCPALPTRRPSIPPPHILHQLCTASVHRIVSFHQHHLPHVAA